MCRLRALCHPALTFDPAKMFASDHTSKAYSPQYSPALQDCLAVNFRLMEAKLMQQLT